MPVCFDVSVLVNTKTGDKMKRKPTIMEIRAVECIFIIMLMLLVAVLRIITVMNNTEYKETATEQTSLKIVASRQRGTIFDTNMRSLTNSESKIVACVEPTYDALAAVRDFLCEETEQELKERLSAGKPVITTLNKWVDAKGVTCANVSENITEKTLSPHLIGSVDVDGHGVSGLQSAFDNILYSDSEVAFTYISDGQGNIVNSFSVQLERDAEIENCGVKTTIDADIQAVVEEVSKDMKSGAVLVAEVGSGKIRALASYPSYDLTRVADYLEAEDSPLINRAFTAYNVGSIFKPCVAAAALEQGKFARLSYECTGSKEIEHKVFACHKEDGHGYVTMKDAISLSCNTFFYTLAQKVGAESICNMASSLGFGQRYDFCDGLYTDMGNLPSPTNVEKSMQSVANLSIGQGELMLTPVSLLPLYEAIANKGVYYRPTLIEGIVTNGVVTENMDDNIPTRVMSEESASFLKQSLFEVVASGTGTAAKPENCTAAGKTATAQTGWKIDGNNVDHSWFCGFFPADEPRYTVVIISENTSGGGTPCAPVFAAVADAVCAIKLS